MTPTSAQFHAARALAGMTKSELATASQVAKSKIGAVESSGAEPPGKAKTLSALQATLEAAGVEFIPGGVRLREQKAVG